ncbi:hypothetical protein [Streptomyces europaeiscabiei]|uniref:hypothetical protein n=1 Tax=Streptomyces europaeiscabiei TaxID=146819 RepID=UPI0029AE5307|nr:hypothetical protein [Streptomyces europaeiscabiei]MDX3583434.1 hypothetical protein [Streptomyces europaeiscabiei]
MDFSLLVGPGGQGKTRFARELVHQRTGDGWAAGFLNSDTHHESIDFSSLVDSAVPVLLVVDYAETRTKQLARLLNTLGGASSIGRIRILLLARSAGRWWNDLRRRHIDLLESTSIHTLATLDNSLDSRREAFDHAIDSFAQALTSADKGVNWQEAANSVGYPDDLDADRYGSPLTLQMTALLGLLQCNEKPGTGYGSTDFLSASLEERILAHEQKYWEDTASDHGLQLHEVTLSGVVAAAALLGASGPAEALDTLARLPGLRDQPEDRWVAVDSWLHDLYPASAGQHWGPLQPDLIGERHIGLQLTYNPELLDLLLTGATDEQTLRALTVLHRALPQHPVIAGQVRRILERDRGRLEPIAVTVAAVANDRSLSAKQGVSKIYSTVSIDDRRVIWDRWLGPEEATQ